MAYTLGEQRGKIIIEADLPGIPEAEEEISKLAASADSKLNAVGGALDKTGKASLAAGGLIATAFAGAVKTASDFEFQLDAIQAVSGATAAEMDQINQAALRIGKDTSFSAQEAGLAMEELVKAGVSVSDTLNGAADATVALAAAGGVDLPTAATIASNAMNQFGLTAQDLVGVTDTIAGAANASAIDVEQFGNSMSQVGAVANLVGLSFDDTALAIAAMGNAGIVGSDAGTSLKSMLTNLNPATDKAAGLMKELGIITEDGANQFYTAEGSIKSLAEISDVLGGALAGMTDQQKQATLSTLFGSDAIRGAAIIADQGSEGFNKLSDSINKTSAAEVAATRMDNLQGRLDALGGSLETAGIVIGQMLLPKLDAMVKGLISVVDAFLELDPKVQENIVSIAGIAAVVLSAVGAMGIMAGAAIRARGAILAMTGAQTLLGNAGVIMAAKTKIAAAATALFNKVLATNPILRIVTLVALLVAGIITLAGGWDEVRAAFQPVIDQLKSSLETLMPVFAQLASTVAGALGTALSAIMPILTSLAAELFPPILEVITALVPVIATLAGVAGELLVAALGLLMPIISAVADLFAAIVPLITPLIDILIAVLVPVLDVVVGALQFVADGLKVFTNMINGVSLTEGVDQTGIFATAAQWLGDVMETLGPIIADVWNNIVAFITPVVEWFMAYVVPTITASINTIVTIFQFLLAAGSAVWNAIFAVVSAVVNWFMTYVAPVIVAAIGLVVAIFTFLFNTAVAIWNGIFAAVSAVVTWFMTYVAPVIVAAINLVVAIFQFLFNTAVAIWNAIMAAIAVVVGWFMTYVAPVIVAAINLVMAIFQFLFNTAVAIWNAIMAAIGVVVGWFMSYVAPTIVNAVNMAVSIFQFLLGIALSVWGAILDFIGGVVNGVMDFISSVWGGLVSFVGGIFDKVFNSIKKPMDKVGSIFDDVYNTIIDVFSNAGSWLYNAGKDIIGGLIEGVQNMLGGLTDVLNGITSMIPEQKGPPEKDKVLLKPAGKMIMQGLMSGMQSEVGDVMKMLNGLNVSIPANFNSDLLANAGSLYVGAKDRTGQEMGGLRQEFHITTTDDGRIAARVIARETQDALEVM